MKPFSQLLAIAHTEFRFGLRRGGPVVVMALIGLVLGAGILMSPISFLSQYHPDPVRLAENGYTLDAFRHISREMTAIISGEFTTMAWQPLLILALFLLPIGTAVTIPADRKHGVAELLRSLPITGGVYLAGKILGVVLTTIFIGLIALVAELLVFEALMFGVLRLGLPAYLIQFYLELAFLDGLPLIVWGATIGVLAGTPFRSRRGTVLPALIVGIGSILFWFRAFHIPEEVRGLNLRFPFIDRAAYYVLQQNNSLGQAALGRLLNAKDMGDMALNLDLLGQGFPRVASEALIAMYVTWLGVLLALAVLARLWLRWRDNF